MSTSRPGRVPRNLIRPLRDFLATEAASGAIIIGAAVVALVWANSPWKAGYETLWHTELTLGLGSRELALDLRHWVNDAVMAIFFLVVGLEIKRELVDGELSAPRKALLPVLAALGGMVVPALLYSAFNAGGDGGRGWGIPMATDIALAIGVLALAGSRVSPSLRLFLLALAIVDDIGAILVIAVFYSDSVDLPLLALAVALLGIVLVMRAAKIPWVSAYVVVGAGAWLALHESGVHATLAGVALGLLTPTSPRVPRDLVDADDMVEELANLSDVEHASRSVDIARGSVSVVEWLEHRLHPWTSFGVVPLFALANAGIHIDRDTVSDALSSTVTLGVMVGLVVGKPAGVLLATWLGTRTGVAALPEGASWSGIAGVALAAGIGFTVSIFVSELAFAGSDLLAEAKIGVLAASVVAAVAALALLRRTSSVPSGRPVAAAPAAE